MLYVVKNGQTIRNALGPKCAATCLIAPRAIGTMSKPTSNGSSPSQGSIQFATRVSWASCHGDRRTSSGGRRYGSPVTVTRISSLHRAFCRDDEPAALCGNRDPFAASFERIACGQGDGQRL